MLFLGYRENDSSLRPSRRPSSTPDQLLSPLQKRATPLQAWRRGISKKSKKGGVEGGGEEEEEVVEEEVIRNGRIRLSLIKKWKTIDS